MKFVDTARGTKKDDRSVEMKPVDTANSTRKDNRSVDMKLVDSARSTKKDDRSVESLIEFIEGGKPMGGRLEKKQKRRSTTP